LISAFSTDDLIEPDMIELIEFVVPRVYAQWRDVGYALKYKTSTINGIEAKSHKDPEESCKTLFEDWLSTDNGTGPKTWVTLLDALKRIKKLAKAREEIIGKVADMFTQ